MFAPAQALTRTLSMPTTVNLQRSVPLLRGGREPCARVARQASGCVLRACSETHSSAEGKACCEKGPDDAKQHSEGKDGHSHEEDGFHAMDKDATFGPRVRPVCTPRHYLPAK